MNSNSCICDSPVLGQIASTAGGAVHHYIIAIIGELLFIRMQEKRVLPFTQGDASAFVPLLHSLLKKRAMRSCVEAALACGLAGFAACEKEK